MRIQTSKSTIFLSVAVTSVAVILLNHCNAVPQSQQDAQKWQQQKEKATYPKHFSLEDSTCANCGLRPLIRVKGLKGSAVWVGTRKSNEETIGKPVLQLVHVNEEGAMSSKYFNLPNYDSNFVGPIRYPLFIGDGQNCFVRLIDPTSDAGRYSLYRLNFKTLKGTLEKEELSVFNPLRVSDSGKYYTYVTSSPYTGQNYALSIAGNDKDRVVSTQKLSGDFKWSHNGKLFYSLSSDKDIYGYPEIHQDDLAGHVNSVKEGAYGSFVSPDESYLGYFYADIASLKDGDPKTAKFNPRRPNNCFLYVLNRNTGKSNAVKKLYGEYLSVMWSGDSKYAYIIENFYLYSKKIAYCRISKYSVIDGQVKLLCKLEQKGEASSEEDGKLIPYFRHISISHGKYILMQVDINSSPVDGAHVLTVDTTSGQRQDILACGSSTSAANLPTVDWLDE